MLSREKETILSEHTINIEIVTPSYLEYEISNLMILKPLKCFPHLHIHHYEQADYELKFDYLKDFENLFNMEDLKLYHSYLFILSHKNVLNYNSHGNIELVLYNCVNDNGIFKNFFKSGGSVRYCKIFNDKDNIIDKLKYELNCK